MFKLPNKKNGVDEKNHLPNNNFNFFMNGYFLVY